jgi:hypothetical protein
MNSTKLQEFLAQGGLFHKIYHIKDFNLDELKALYLGSSYSDFITFDAYCQKCGNNSTYSNRKDYSNTDWKEDVSKTEDENIKDLLTKINDKVFTFNCARDRYHKIRIVINAESWEKSIEKYGHYPSMDTAIYDRLSPYNNYLPDDCKDLQLALKLNNQGVYIGAFVYLRRVFERRIIQEYENNKSTFPIDDKKFYKQYKMEQKIELLKNYLPNFVVDNKKTLYPLLSKGVHEWTENECEIHFPMVFQSIILILDKVVTALEQKEKEGSLTNAMADLKASLSNNN